MQKTKPNKQSSAEEVADTQSGTQHRLPLCAPTAELETTTATASWSLTPGATDIPHSSAGEESKDDTLKSI